MRNEEARLSLHMEAATKEKLDRWYTADGCRSRTEFVEKAILFYISYLEMEDGNVLLPTAVQSAMDGRLGLLEKKLSTLLFRQAVELDSLTTLIAADRDLDDNTLRLLRADSVNNVRRVNGQLSLEQKVRENREETWQD